MCKGSQNAQLTAMRTAILDTDREHVFHPFTVLGQHERTGPLMIVEGSGSVVRDTEGREYIDGMAGLWCVNAGYSRREIADAIHAQAVRLPYYHSFSSMATEMPALLAERLLAMAPVPMSKVFFGSSGSDANDTQVKLVWFYNNALGRPLRRRSSRETGATTASRSPRRASPGSRACTRSSTCRCR